MKSSKRAPLWLFAAAAAMAIVPAGCMAFDDGLEGEIELRTNVQDWRDEVIYQLLVDRFADGDAGNNYRVDLTAAGKWHGGDWKGVEDKLDYLEALGVTSLWISPVVKNVDTDAGFDGYHGYWAQDLTATNPHFGDLVALRSLVRAAHDRGMKVILDIVTNHLGQLFYYDINMNGEPDDRVAGDGTPGLSGVTHVNEYDPDFDPRGVQARTSLGESGPAPIIFVHDAPSNHIPPMPILFQSPEVYNRRGRTFDFEVRDQLLHGDFPGGLKDVNTTRCDVKESMVDVYARWVELTDLDGFRIDTVKHVEGEFWRYFTQKVRKRLAAKGKKNFLMFGEAFDGGDERVGSFTRNDLVARPAVDANACAPYAAEEQACVIGGEPITEDMLDSVFYFPQYFQAIRDVFQNAGSTKGIESLWAARPTNYGTVPTAGGTGLPPNKLLVNFLDNHDVPRFLYAGTGTSSLQNALLFLMTEDGIPCVYYGTEQELSGGNDPANREDLWDTGYDTSKGTFQWLARLTRIRKGYAALRRGDQSVVWATDHTGDEPDAGTFAFERAGGDAGDAYALVVFNSNKVHESTTAFEGTTMTTSLPGGTVLVDVLSGANVTVGADQALSITLPPESGAILVPQTQVIPGL